MFTCFAGCDRETILDALRLTWADVFAERDPQRPLPPRVDPEIRLRQRVREASRPVDAVLEALRPNFRATEDRRVWTGRCPVCEADRLVIVEDEHDPLDPTEPTPQVRVSCMAGCAGDEIHAKLEAAA